MPELCSNLLQCSPSLCLSLGDHMYPAKVLKGGPTPASKHASLNKMILHADGFAGVFPKHKYEIIKCLQDLSHLCAMIDDGTNDAPTLFHASVGIAVEGATDAARDAADIVLTEPGLHHRSRHPQFLYHFPMYEELFDLCLRYHYPYRRLLRHPCVRLQVQLPSLHDFGHRPSQQWNHHGILGGSRFAIANSR